MQDHLRYDPRAALLAACEQMLEAIENQLAEDGGLPTAERDAAPLAALAGAIGTRGEPELIAAGRAAADWITRNGSEDERFEWMVGCPHPDVEQYETAVEQLKGGADAG